VIKNIIKRKEMKKKLVIATVFAVMFTLTGCYSSVPAGTKGKILGKNGFQAELYPPSKVWLSDNIWNFTKEKLYLVETTTQKYKERINVKLKDKLELTFDVYFRGRVINDDKVLNSIFNDMKMNDNIITTDEVYDVYGKMIVRKVAREVVSQFNVDEVHVNFDRLSSLIYNKLKVETKHLPIQLSDVTVGEIQYPKMVTDAIDAAKKRRMEIEQEKASVQIALTKKRGEEELAKADYRIKILNAKKDRDANKIVSEGITKDLLELRKLELRELELKTWNGVLPTTVVGDSDVPVIIGRNSK